METVTSPLTLDQAFSEYTSVYLSARNLAHKTRVDYTIDVTQLLTFLQDRGITNVAQLDLSQLNAFLADMDTRELSGYTRRRKVSSIKSFCSFLESLGYVTKNPALRLIPPKRESTTPRVLTEGEYKRLQLAVANQPRDAAIIEVLLQTGIRLSEIAGLTLTDIEIPQKISKDAENVGSVLIRRGKGRKDRVIALNYKELRVLVLNTKNQVIANLLLYKGTVDSSVLRIAEIFQPAITRKCPGIIVCHNHPSGLIEATKLAEKEKLMSYLPGK